MQSRSLVSQSNWMVSKHVFPISVLGLAVGFYLDSSYLMIGGAILLGIGIAPVVPVWTEETGQHATKFRENAQLVKGFPIYYWCLVSFVVISSVSGLIGKLFT
ncbi:MULTISPECIES: hypothetical protein [Vibrio]|uniref:hypothetical protein n=1 Tax=Vibrio TaxID=662 RepID=UPI0004182B2F|nr:MULTISPECIES: hypothetical protein [Vibrio]MBY7933110.1 hypothetical protein [Vibrio fluvialis]MBY7933116.1 hypothetical protein [Vibrio fluvialis]MCG6230216.1 hypothetical protein [Vibrio furnissii]MCG6268485.1 hypothetical protein [Vibrio furnissii]